MKTKATGESKLNDNPEFIIAVKINGNQLFQAMNKWMDKFWQVRGFKILYLNFIGTIYLGRLYFFLQFFLIKWKIVLTFRTDL